MGNARGRRLPARPNRRELPTQQVQYVIQRRGGGTWTTIVTQIATVSKIDGTAAFDVTFNSAGSYRLRANLLPTPVNANSFPTEFEYYTIS